MQMTPLLMAESEEELKSLLIKVKEESKKSWLKTQLFHSALSLSSRGSLVLLHLMVTHSSILAWRIPWAEEPGGLQSIGSQRVRHD